MEYRNLNEGEVLQRGDEWYRILDNTWRPTECAGTTVPTQNWIIYRRLVKGASNE